jgi:hypothetical protein
MAQDPLPASNSSRLGAGALGAATAALAIWISVRNLSLPARDGWIFWVPIALLLLTMSLLCWWSALGPAHRRADTQASWKMGWTVGAVGLTIGFVGPLLLNPDANLGPLLGILITGPLGFVAGAAAVGLSRALQWSR